MADRKILFLDRDGTLINEPPDGIIDSLEKLQFIPGVVSALAILKAAGYRFVIVSNQKGIGSERFPQANFDTPHQAMLDEFAAHDVTFDDVLICPHLAEEGCECRKPKLGLIERYLQDSTWDRSQSYVVGDRETDVVLAEGMGIRGLLLGAPGSATWDEIVRVITSASREVA